MFLSNPLWHHYKKCGLSTTLLNKRISSLQTSLFCDCEIVYTTKKLVDCHFYEYLLKKILSNFRLRSDREFYDVYDDEIRDIYETFNELNETLNTSEKLLEYIKNCHPEYFQKKLKFKLKIKSKKSTIYIDTSN